MYENIKEGTKTVAYTYKGVCYVGIVLDNNNIQVVLQHGQYYDHEWCGTFTKVALNKEDIEFMANTVN